MADSVKLGKPMSVRFREGDPELIKAYTGRPAGEVIRDMVAAYVERIKLEVKQKEQSKDG